MTDSASHEISSRVEEARTSSRPRSRNRARCLMCKRCEAKHPVIP